MFEVNLILLRHLVTDGKSLGGQRQGQHLQGDLTEALEVELRHESRVSSLGKASKYNRCMN